MWPDQGYHYSKIMKLINKHKLFLQILHCVEYNHAYNARLIISTFTQKDRVNFKTFFLQKNTLWVNS